MAVLIYRLGRLGDTMVALPALRVIQRAFPGQRRILLADRAPAPTLSPPHLLAGTGIIDGVIEYQAGERHPAALWRLARTIRRTGARTLVYLTEPRGGWTVLRDWAFFRACGLRTMIGVPWSRDLAEPRSDGCGGREAEASRLARVVAPLGDARLGEPASWQLCLSAEEEDEAARALAATMGERPFIALDVTAKPAIREWGEERWRHLLAEISGRHPGLGAVFCGGSPDCGRVHRLAAAWNGPVLDNCGHSPRRFYAWLRHARLFVGIDSGPMHLAAAAGTPVVAVAASQHRPGHWHPAGRGHLVLRAAPQPPCAGCELRQCPRGNACIDAVPAERVVAACLDRLSGL